MFTSCPHVDREWPYRPFNPSIRQSNRITAPQLSIDSPLNQFRPPTTINPKLSRPEKCTLPDAQRQILGEHGYIPRKSDAHGTPWTNTPNVPMMLTALHGHKHPQRSNDATAPPQYLLAAKRVGGNARTRPQKEGVRPGGTSTVDQGTMIFGRGVPHEVRTVAMIRGKQSYAPRRFAECMSTSDALVSLISQRNQLISLQPPPILF